MNIIVRKKGATKGKKFEVLLEARGYLANQVEPHELVVNGAIVVKNY